MIDLCKKAIGDNPMITNSYRAAEMWGFGTPIWHGLDPEEWFDLPKEPRVITMISPAGLDDYYDRTFLRYTREALHDIGINHCHITVDWRSKDWEDYRRFLGSSLIYFNPTKESPMPRSRTEAMMSGCCVLTTNNHDTDKYIVDGQNGIFVKRNPQDVVKKVLWCMKNYDQAVKIGQAGKQTAIAKFNHKRFEQNWKDFLNDKLNIKI